MLKDVGPWEKKKAKDKKKVEACEREFGLVKWTP